MRNYTIRLAIALLTVCFTFWGCSGTSNYELGWYTKAVKGKLALRDGQKPEEAFILVLNYHRTMIETSKGGLMSATASITHPNEIGEYEANFDADTSSLELIIYAENCKIESARYDRSLGLGAYIFNQTLQRDDNWRNSFYLMVKPILIDYINDDRYQMSQMDKYFLGEWLTKAEDKL